MKGDRFIAVTALFGLLACDRIEIRWKETPKKGIPEKGIPEKGTPEKGTPATPGAVGTGLSAGARSAGAGDTMPAPPAAEETKPVYPQTLSGPESPQAVQYCQAVHGLPARRRGECCASGSDAMLYADCVRVLTYAQRSGALQVDEASLAACAQAQEEAYSGCEWVGPWPLELPGACRQALRGVLAAGARCRSSLECSGGLFCHGAGPTSPGTCEVALPDGERCALSVDALAAFTRLESVTQPHPQHTLHRECAGFCNLRHVCEPLRPRGGECVMSSQCGADERCGNGRCIPGRVGQVGQACSGGDCAAGLRCHGHICQTPKGQGGLCSSDFDCLGGCEGSAEGPKHCAPKCSAR